MSERDDFQKWINSHNPPTNHPLQTYEYAPLTPDEITALVADVYGDAPTRHHVALERLLQHFIKVLHYLIKNRRIKFGYPYQLALTDAMIGFFNAVRHAATEGVELSIKLVSKYVNAELHLTKRDSSPFPQSTAAEDREAKNKLSPEADPQLEAAEAAERLSLSPEAEEAALRLLIGDTRDDLKSELGAKRWNSVVSEVNNRAWEAGLLRRWK